MNKIFLYGFSLIFALVSCAPQKGQLSIRQTGSVSFEQAATAFSSTVHPILKNRCGTCHGDSEGQSPFFAKSAYDEAWSVLWNSAKMNVYRPEESRLYLRLKNESHNCWGDCSQNAEEMLAAIRSLASQVDFDKTFIATGPIAFSQHIEGRAKTQFGSVTLEAETGDYTGRMQTGVHSRASSRLFAETPEPPLHPNEGATAPRQGIVGSCTDHDKAVNMSNGRSGPYIVSGAGRHPDESGFLPYAKQISAIVIDPRKLSGIQGKWDDFTREEVEERFGIKTFYDEGYVRISNFYRLAPENISAEQWNNSAGLSSNFFAPRFGGNYWTPSSSQIRQTLTTAQKQALAKIFEQKFFVEKDAPFIQQKKKWDEDSKGRYKGANDPSGTPYMAHDLSDFPLSDSNQILNHLYFYSSANPAFGGFDQKLGSALSDSSFKNYSGQPLDLNNLFVSEDGVSKNISVPLAGRTPGKIAFPIQITEAGKYNLWSRVIARGDSGNSFYFRLKGTSGEEAGKCIRYEFSGNTTAWTWYIPNRDGEFSRRPGWDLKAGEYVLEVLEREDGAMLDLVALSKEQDFEPHQNPGALRYISDARPKVLRYSMSSILGEESYFEIDVKDFNDKTYMFRNPRFVIPSGKNVAVRNLGIKVNNLPRLTDNSFEKIDMVAGGGGQVFTYASLMVLKDLGLEQDQFRFTFQDVSLTSANLEQIDADVAAPIEGRECLALDQFTKDVVPVLDSTRLIRKDQYEDYLRGYPGEEGDNETRPNVYTCTTCHNNQHPYFKMTNFKDDPALFCSQALSRVDFNSYGNSLLLRGINDTFNHAGGEILYFIEKKESNGSVSWIGDFVKRNGKFNQKRYQRYVDGAIVFDAQTTKNQVEDYSDAEFNALPPLGGELWEPLPASQRKNPDFYAIKSIYREKIIKWIGREKFLRDCQVKKVSGCP